MHTDHGLQLTYHGQSARLEIEGFAVTSHRGRNDSRRMSANRKLPPRNRPEGQLEPDLLKLARARALPWAAPPMCLCSWHSSYLSLVTVTSSRNCRLEFGSS